MQTMQPRANDSERAHTSCSEVGAYHETLRCQNNGSCEQWVMRTTGQDRKQAGAEERSFCAGKAYSNSIMTAQSHVMTSTHPATIEQK